MKTRIIAIASILSALSISTASAGTPAPDNLWFTLLSTSDPSITANTQGPGQTLDIWKPLPGPATVRIGVNITSITGALSGWSLSLLSSAGGLFANGLQAGSAYDQNIGDVVNNSPAADFGRGSSSFAGSTGLVYSFDLVLAGPVPVLVTGDFGVPNGILYSNGLYWYGFVGANPITYGCSSCYSGGSIPDVTPGWGQLPVISVTPEPTTLGLVGLGIVLLVRRKR